MGQYGTSIKFLRLGDRLPVWMELEGDLGLVPGLGGFSVPALRTLGEGDFSRAKLDAKVHLKKNCCPNQHEFFN